MDPPKRILSNLSLEDVVAPTADVKGLKAFSDTAKNYLLDRKYFISEENREVIEHFFRRIHSAIILGNPHMPDNRISTILCGHKQCGKTSLMKLTANFLRRYNHTLVVYFECRGDRPSNKSPFQLWLEEWEKTRENIPLPESVKKGSIDNFLEHLRDQQIRPFIFYDEADNLWAVKSEDVTCCTRIIDELHAIGNAGLCFGCISGSTWKLKHLAYRYQNCPLSLVNSYPSLFGYQSLNSQKYRELSLQPLGSLQTAMSFAEFHLEIQREEVVQDDVQRALIKSGGRYSFFKSELQCPTTNTLSPFDTHVEINTVYCLYDAFVQLNLNLLSNAYDASTKTWNYDQIVPEKWSPLAYKNVEKIMENSGGCGSQETPMDYVDMDVLLLG
eukprot:gene10580-11724_t